VAIKDSANEWSRLPANNNCWLCSKNIRIDIAFLRLSAVPRGNSHAIFDCQEKVNVECGQASIASTPVRHPQTLHGLTRGVGAQKVFEDRRLYRFDEVAIKSRFVRTPPIFVLSPAGHGNQLNFF